MTSADFQKTSRNIRYSTINSISNLLQEFREINPDLPVQIAATLCIIAENPGITQVEIVKLGRMQAAAVNRHVKVLGRYNPKQKVGYGLISADVDPDDTRRKLLHLTAEGHIRVNRLVECLQVLNRNPSENLLNRTTNG